MILFWLRLKHDLAWVPHRGLVPRNASSQQAYTYAHIVEHLGEQELHAGVGAVSGGGTAGEPKPRIPLPDELSDSARDKGYCNV